MRAKLSNWGLFCCCFRREGLSLSENIGETLGKVGPSMLLTSSSEIFCFAIGKLICFNAKNVVFHLSYEHPSLFCFKVKIDIFCSVAILNNVGNPGCYELSRSN